MMCIKIEKFSAHYGMSPNHLTIRKIKEDLKVK